MKRIPTYKNESVQEMYEQVRIHYLSKKDKIDIYDDFSLGDISQHVRKYVNDEKLNIKFLISDLQRILVCIEKIPRIFMIKVLSEDKKYSTIEPKTESECQKYFSAIRFLCRDKNTRNRITISCWDVIYSNLKYFSFSQVSFFSTDKSYFSIFHGFPYEELVEFDRKIIMPLLNHTFEIICNKNRECFDFISKWLSYLFQNPGKRTNTSIILVGQQGAGKNIWTNVICELLGNYANPNARLDNIFGSYNSGVFQKMLIVINEVGSYLEISKGTMSKIKAAITENHVDINPKHKEIDLVIS